MKQLVIFDLDGTLLNTIDDLGCAANHALTAMGFPCHVLQTYPMMVGNGVRRLIERALPPEERNDNIIEQMLRHFREYYDEHLRDNTRPYPGIDLLIAELQRRGINMAVASNKYESATRKLITHFFGDTTFASICGHIEGMPVKPDPSVVFRVLTECPTPKADVLYVGDSGIDMETARRACVDSAGVTWGFRPRRELVAAFAGHIVSDPADILGLL